MYLELGERVGKSLLWEPFVRRVNWCLHIFQTVLAGQKEQLPYCSREKWLILTDKGYYLNTHT